MQKVVLCAVIAIAVLALAGSVCAEPEYIYAMHDNGGEGHMADMGTKGWIVFTEEIGHDPNNHYGKDYSSWYNQGYGVIVRLNNGYGGAGTIPYDTEYANFAQRCANFVAASPGIHYVIIANETNLPCEWPGNVDGNPNTGQPITVARYVSCYNQCYTSIKNVVPTAKIIPAAVGTWSPPWPGQGIEEFDTYFVNLMNGIGASKIDGIALHTYTHGCDPSLVFSEQKMGPPYEDIYYHFRAYKNYMWIMPSTMTTKPVFITETDQNIECASGGYTWLNANNGWVKNVYYEINQWNLTPGTQKIRCVALFRWPDVWQGQWNFSVSTKPGVIQDWREAMAFGYKWNTDPCANQNDAGQSGDAGNTFSTARSITPGSYTGYLEKNCDDNDYYKFGVTSGQSISCSMTPPTSADYNLYLYNPAGSLKAQSTLGTGQTETINFTADSSGDWRLRAYAVSGAGNYSFGVTVSAANPGGTNLTPSIPTTLSCGHYGEAWRAKHAKDASITTKWCCAHNGLYTPGDHWLAYDIGSNATVTGYKLKHPSMAGDDDRFNMKEFYIESASSLQGPWTQEFYVNNATRVAENVLVYGTPKTLRYVRVRVTDPSHDADWAVRLQEFEVWGTAGTPQAIKFEAEDYDGGFGAISDQDYYDTDSGNTGGAYRSHNVDIENCSEGGYNVGWIAAGEWLRFPWRATSTTFTLNIRHAGTSNGTCHLEVDGVNKTGSISLPSTGGWQTWATKNAGTITVTAGEHDIKLVMDSAGFNINYFTLQPTTVSTGTISGYVKDTSNNAIVGATVSTNTGGYSTTSGANGSYTLSNVVVGTYDVTASKTGYISQTQTGKAVTSGQTTTVNFNLTPSTTISESFETMPSWSSSYDASWGSAATWSIASGGQSGNFLQAARGSGGSSAKVKVYTVPANTSITISIYMKCPSYGASYWMESAYKLGSYTAQDFDGNGGTWTMIKKFANDGTNGNGNTWTQYSATVNTGSNTQISIGYKLGSSGAGPTVGWDTFRIQ